jgi:hypothetical protein
VCVRGVVDGEPKDLRRRTELLEQADEIAVFGQYDGVRLPSGEENLAVFASRRPRSRTGFESTSNSEESHCAR